jgi:hypothetical protein
MSARLHATVSVFLLMSSSVYAQNYTGTYAATNTQGAVVTLTLQQDAGGNLAGTMVGGDVQFQIEGMVEEGIAVGAMYDQQGGVLFEAQLQGNELLLSLFEVGPDGEPDYEQSREVVLTRSGLGAAPARPGPSGANPLGGANPLAGAGADPFAGDYTGESVALTLQGSGGNYTGKLTFQGTAYPVNASTAGNTLSGTFAAGGETYSFTASLQGNQLSLDSGGRTYRLTRQSATAGTANPLGGGGAMEITTGGGLLGRWSCRTAEGMAQLDFLSDSQLSFNGERSQYSIVQGAVRVMEQWGPADYRYQQSGDNLTVMGPDGSSMQCTRTAQNQSGADTGGSGGLEQLLRGEKCGYSSSPDGGFSTTRRLMFDGQSRFVYTTLSEVDAPEVIGYGQASGDPGSYRVMGANKGDEVHLMFDNGDRIVMYVHHLYRGEIMELWYNDIVYAPGLCPGAEP